MHIILTGSRIFARNGAFNSRTDHNSESTSSPGLSPYPPIRIARSPSPSGTRKNATDVPALYVNCIGALLLSGTSLKVVPTSKLGFVAEQNSDGSVQPTPSRVLQNSLSTFGNAIASSPALKTYITCLSGSSKKSIFHQSHLCTCFRSVLTR